MPSGPDADPDDIERVDTAHQRVDRQRSPFPFFEEADDPDLVTSVDLEADHEGTALRESLDDGGEPSPSKRLDASLATLEIEMHGGETYRTEVDSPRFLIGRSSVDLALEDDFVSPWHAQLFAVEDVLVLEDMDSDNGVFLRIADQLTLEDGDEIIMGHQHFIFREHWTPPELTARGRDSSGSTPELGAPPSGSPVRLFHYFAGGTLGGVYRIGDQLSIGRDDADITCRQDSTLASTHAVLVRDDDSYVLQDLGSEYGTFIRVPDAVDLIDGDCFVVGRTRIEISYH